MKTGKVVSTTPDIRPPNNNHSSSVSPEPLETRSIGMQCDGYDTDSQSVIPEYVLPPQYTNNFMPGSGSFSYTPSPAPDQEGYNQDGDQSSSSPPAAAFYTTSSMRALIAAASQAVAVPVPVHYNH